MSVLSFSTAWAFGPTPEPWHVRKRTYDKNRRHEIVSVIGLIYHKKNAVALPRTCRSPIMVVRIYSRQIDDMIAGGQ